MNIMNKLYKCALWLLTAFTLSFACFSSAESIESLIPWDLQTITVKSKSFYTIKDLISSEYSTYCVYVEYITWWPEIFYWFNSTLSQELRIWSFMFSDWPSWIYQCMYVNLRYLFFYNAWNTNLTVRFKVFDLIDFLNSDYPIYSSLQCQTEYNLIPVNDVNANYCNLNFWMIDPKDCPKTEWSWAISWTPRFINDEQYPWTNLLNINIPNDIAHTVIYNEEETIVNVEWYNADENYINWILQNEKLTPTNKDIEEMITWFMVNYFPYLALAIVFLYLARKIFKIFK